MRQLSFADRARPSVDSTFRTARRIPLDARSWVEFVPGWLSGADALFETLLRTAAWEQRALSRFPTPLCTASCESWRYPTLTAWATTPNALPKGLRAVVNSYRFKSESEGFRPSCRSWPRKQRRVAAV